MDLLFQRIISSKVILVADVRMQPILLQILCSPGHPLRVCYTANMWVDFRYFGYFRASQRIILAFTDVYIKNIRP